MVNPERQYPMLNFKFSIMRHYFTSRLFLFLFVLFGCVMATNGQSLKTVKNWNFLSWSETTLANLGADATSWEAEIDADTQVLKRYKNLETVDAKNVLKANGVVIAETDGILFPALTKGNLSLRINMGDDGIESLPHFSNFCKKNFGASPRSIRLSESQ